MEALFQPCLITSNVYCYKRGTWGLTNCSWVWREELLRKNHVCMGWKMKRKLLIGQVRRLPPASRVQSLSAPCCYPSPLPLSASELTLQLLTSAKTEKIDGTRRCRWPLSSSRGGGIFLAAFQVRRRWRCATSPPRPERGNVLGRFGLPPLLPSAGPGLRCQQQWYGGAAGRAKNKWHLWLRRLPPRCCAESRAFPGSPLLRWPGYCPAPLCSGERPLRHAAARGCSVVVLVN